MIAVFTGTLPLLAQAPIIRVPVRVVAVPTAVVSKAGQFIRGLQGGEFSLFDNDRRQSLRVDAIEEPVSLAIVVQNGDAVRTWLPQVRRVASMIEALVLGETGEASLSVFGDDVKLLQPMTGNIGRLDKAFKAITPSSDNKSRSLDAIEIAVKQLEAVSPERRRVVLVVAQAGDTGSTAIARDVLQSLERNNIAVFSLVMPRVGKDLIGKTIAIRDAKSVLHANDIGIAGTVDLGKLVPEIYRAEKTSAGEDALTVLTAQTGGRLIPFRKLHDLETGISAIGEELHTEYVLSYTPDSQESGYHRILVQVDRREAVVRARPGYYILPPDLE